MQEYIQKRVNESEQYLESGIHFRNKDQILAAKNTYVSVFIMAKGTEFFDDIKEKLVRALTSLCIIDENNALTYLNEAIIYNPDHPVIYNNLGFIYHKKYNNFDMSVSNYNKCLKLDPCYAMAYLGIIDLYRTLRHHTLEVAYCKKGITNCPESAELWNAYGLAMVYSGVTYYNNFQQFFDCFNKARTLLENMEATPENLEIKAKVFVNIGFLHGVVGDYQVAVDHYLEAIKCNQRHMNAFQNILLNLHYFGDDEVLYNKDSKGAKTFGDLLTTFSVKKNPGKSAAVLIHELHEKICLCMYGESTSFPEPPVYNKDPLRKIRIGYVSSDIFMHAVSYFSETLFKNYNKESFEVRIYANNIYDAGMVDTLPCDGYKCIFGVTDEKAAQIIRDDKIDILIDLNGQTSGNRLDVFIKRPSPICLQYLGYPNDNGLPFMKRISDEYTEKYSPSKAYRLKTLFLQYNNTKLTPGKKVRSQRKQIVFGCFAKLQKISSECISLWNDLLKELPEAKLILKSKYFNDVTISQNWKRKFDVKVSDRIMLLKGTDSVETHMEMYNLIDIHLDSFPYSGTTITTEALAMNVPVVTFSPVGYGKKIKIGHVSRVTGSILHSMGLTDLLVASNKIGYIKKSIDLHNLLLDGYDPKIREKFLASPINNPKSFMMNYENLLAEIYLENFD